MDGPVICLRLEAASAFSRLLGRAILICVLAGATPPAEAQTNQDQAEQAARARELLLLARHAIGLESSQPPLWSLSAAGGFRRFVKYISVQSPTKVVERQRVLSGKLQVDFLLPDKFRRHISNRGISGRRYAYTEVVNGALAWRDPPPPVISSYRDNRIIDVGDIERSREKYAEDARQQLAFYTLGWILETPPALPSEFLYAGEVRTDDRILEAIIVNGPNGFRPVLLLDHKTHLPFALVVALVEPKRETVIVEVASVSRQFITDTYARARREREARRTPAQRRELQWRFSDHQPVDGLLLPRRITTFIDGEITEELTISQFKVNQPINLRRFEGRPEVR